MANKPNRRVSMGKKQAQAQSTLENLRTLIPAIFQESQKTTGNHRKNAIALRKIQEQCAEAGAEEGEAAFFKEFIRNLNVVLAVKKREPAADRVIQFVSAFILCTREKDIENSAGKESENMDEDDEGEEGISSRFVESLMHHLLKGVRVKDKHVRLRSCQLIALSTNSLGAMDDDLYQELKSSLMERIRDKESAVRVQAVFALSKLQGGDEDGEVDSVVAKMLDVMRHDPAADVRRSALFNIEHTKSTMPYILERARDVDAYNRRGVYSKPMDEIPDFRVLSISDREKLLRHGLSDRDAGVKKACTKMLSTKWIHQAEDNLIEFLERLDVMSSSVADDVLKAFFEYRSDILGSLNFNDVFWANLTVESALLVRTYAEYCCSQHDDIAFEKAIPEVTRHAYHIQKYSNSMQEAGEDDRPEAEFIVTQLLMIAKLLDYSDENGRRMMFNLLREMLMLSDIPDKHLDCIVETIGKISLNEKDFTRIVIEIISDIRAAIDEQEFLRNPAESEDDSDEQSPDERTPDENTIDMLDTPRKRKRSIVERPRRRSVMSVGEVGQNKNDLDTMLIRVRCLTITKCMLERSEEPLKENSYVYGLLNELVIPALGRQEEVMQELGLQCLGLICVLDQTLAQSNMDLFLTCIFAANASDQLKSLSLKIVFDLILTFGMTNMSAQVTEERIHTDLLKSLDDSSEVIQAIAAEGVAKLMLTKLLKSPEVMQKLVILYFIPETANNNHLRQCLNYFLQVCFHSAHENQVVLAPLVTPILVTLIEKFTESNGSMPTPNVMGQQLLEWVEPKRVLGADSADASQPGKAIDFGLPANIGIDIAKLLFTEERNHIRKHLVAILHKVRMDNDAGEIRLKTMTLLLGNLKVKRPLKEPASRKYILSIEKSILKLFEDAPETLDDSELAKLEELTATREFVDAIEEQDEPEFEPVRSTRGGGGGGGAGTGGSGGAGASSGGGGGAGGAGGSGRATRTRAASGRAAAAAVSDKLAKMLKEVDALLDSSEDEEEEADGGSDSDD
ncbi:hypothetical protein DFQ26_007599 [Actinomortierella ambigua]|nr:hypothetical protein DFQ26_007599 [Actinomortierella ambigua]